MKMTKKKVFTVALAVCLIAILSLSSLAWFSASDDVTNNFLVAGSDDGNPNDIFSIDVTEEGDEEDDGLTYNDILPGDLLDKNVTVTNTGSYDQYIRVLVEITDGAAWTAAMGEDYPIENCFVGFDATKWDCDTVYIQSKDVILVVAYGKEILPAKENNSIQLFTDVMIPESLTKEQVAAFKGGFDITVKAQAVQTENVGDYAYAAFQTVGWSAFEDYTD